jgi:hypothetical protein
MKSKIFIVFLLLASTMSFAQSISEVYFPKYMQGVGSFVFADERRVPFACRLTVNGLLPNATYRYFNRFLLDPANPVSIGEGGYILVKDTGNFIRVTSASLGTPGRYGEFTTDTAGSYTGWFIGEPSVSTTFKPGNNVYFRLVLNNGAGDIVPTTLITAPNPVRVINFGTTADTLSGTAVRATPVTGAIPKQFVFLYDNPLSQGRPVAGTFLESDGSNNNVAAGYAPFYADSVNAINNAWGTIIPNVLPNGIRRIDRFALDGDFKKSYYPIVFVPHFPFIVIDKWPSVNNTVIDTKNPTGGLASVLVIDGARLLGISLWLSTEQTTDDLITLQWNTTDQDAQEFVIEKSVDGGKTFAALRTVKKAGQKDLYELQDSRTEAPAYYRVTTSSKEGKLVSDVLKVDGVIKLGIFPNPVADQLLVQHPQAEKGASLQVIGVDGRQLMNQNVAEGAVQTKVSVKQLVAGNYFVIYQVNGQRQSKLFIKK